jgi:phosphoribosylcarboxyaminoimidazole (NCAIR) mutase
LCGSRTIVVLPAAETEPCDVVLFLYLATFTGSSSFLQVLEEFGVPLELTVVSAHRTPERMVEYARTAPQRGLKVIIAGAGEEMCASMFVMVFSSRI